MNEHPATLLRCVVERITYQNPENGYSVLKVKVKGYNDLVTLVGNLLEVPVGSVLLCRGEWKVDKRYGSQFVAATWEETMPATVYGIEKYLGSGLVKGIGPRFARAIVQRFGTETIDLIVTVCTALVIIGGIKRIANVSQVVVPFMAVLYVVFAVLLLLCNVTKIPDAIVQIVQGAFG